MISAFKVDGVSGKVILPLTVQELKADLGVKQFGRRKLILMAVEEHRATHPRI